MNLGRQNHELRMVLLGELLKELRDSAASEIHSAKSCHRAWDIADTIALASGYTKASPALLKGQCFI